MKTVVSNSTFGRESLSPTSIKPFDECANGGKTEEWLGGMDSNQSSWMWVNATSDSLSGRIFRPPQPSLPAPPASACLRLRVPSCGHQTPTAPRQLGSVLLECGALRVSS